MKIGFDFGSKNIHYAIIEKNKVLHTANVGHKGDIPGSFIKLIFSIFEEYSREQFESFGITGKSTLSNFKFIDSIIATVEANKFLETNARSILSIGCESFSLVLTDKSYDYVEHIINSDCASGTGSFVDQQAEILGFTTEELGEKASVFEGKVPVIASRCAVFAKSDIVHAQTQGYSKEAISAGLCEGVARSVLANVVKGRELAEPLIITGGVSHNAKIVKSIKERLEIKLACTEHSTCFEAIGAAILGSHNEAEILDFIETLKVVRKTRPELKIHLPNYPDFALDTTFVEDEVEITVYKNIDKEKYDIYLGVDIGSTSTKMLAINSNNDILAGFYTKTKADPVAAVSLILQKFKKIFKNSTLNTLGVGTTGSGRKLIESVLKADVSINEISAHAIGATHIDPLADTIIEIGGQDAKFTLLQQGEVSNSIMNYVCAAGTGSFIEEQSKRLGIKLSDIEELAMGSAAPFTSDRCTVYMERDLNTLLSEGWSQGQIITSVLYSVRDNYLSKVVGKVPFGEHIFFQGATARNKALVSVFAQGIGKDIHVSRYCHQTGSLGAALHAKSLKLKSSDFQQDVLKYTRTTELCKLCQNQCELNIYQIGDRKAAWGLKCGRDYESKRVKKLKKSNLEVSHNKIFVPKKVTFPDALTVGLPRSLHMEHYLPLFANFFSKLGINTTIASSSRKVMDSGKDIVCADFCAPMNLAHGQVKQLVKKDVDFVFFPAILNEQDNFNKFSKEQPYVTKENDCFYCYYSISAPMIIQNLVSGDFSKKILSPLIKLNNNPIEMVSEDIAKSLSGKLGISKNVISSNFLEAYSEFTELEKAWKKQGDLLLNKKSDGIKVLLLGRPYAVLDNTINQQIPAKIEELGIDVIHQSMLDLEKVDKTNMPEYISKLHWFFGQQILLALEYTRKYDNVYPIFTTCFKCSPDAYAISYFKTRMKQMEKPYLILQLDELGGDVGYQTRIEAAVSSFYHHYEKKIPAHPDSIDHSSEVCDHPIKKGDTIFFPYIDEITNQLMGMAYRAHGFKFKSLKPTPQSLNEGYQHSSGGECMPNAAIMGAIFDEIRKPGFEVKKTVFVCWTLCLMCNFPQFFKLIRMALKKAGYPDVRTRTYNLSSIDLGHPPLLMLDILSTVSISGSLSKAYYYTKAYEKTSGDVDKVLENILKKYEDSLFSKSRPLGKLSQYLYLLSNIALNCLPIFPKRGGLMTKLNHILHPNKPLLNATIEAERLFSRIPLKKEKKARIAIIGDLYVKWNSLINQQIYDLVHDLDGEIILTSLTEYPLSIQYTDMKKSFFASILYRLTRRLETSFSIVLSPFIKKNYEPCQREMDKLARDYGVEHEIAGELEVNIGRVLYMVKNDLCDAILNLNPVLCCPGTLSTSIFRKMQHDFNIPIIDIFYDGSNTPNQIIVPHLHYLKENLVNKKQHNCAKF
jgi:predicted CoA-substrate-specific enzyme activase